MLLWQFENQKHICKKQSWQQSGHTLSVPEEVNGVESVFYTFKRRYFPPFWVACFFIIIILQYNVRMKHKGIFFSPTIGIAMATPQISDKVWSCTDSHISICFRAKRSTACEKHFGLSS